MNKPDGSRRLLRGLNTSVSGNSQAFGFSITITVTFGLMSSAEGNPTLPELFGFTMSAVCAFSLLNLAVAHVLSDRDPSAPRRVVLVATATDFLAVGAALAAAVGIGFAASGWAAWVLAPFCAGLVYVLVESVELSVGQDRDQEEP